MNYMFKFKKMELLIHKISSHELLLNMNKFHDILHALDYIGNNRDTTAIESYNLVLKYFLTVDPLIRYHDNPYNTLNIKIS